LRDPRSCWTWHPPERCPNTLETLPETVRRF
jgi:hypothetical protein